MAWSTEEVRDFFASHWTVRAYKQVSIPAEHLDVILDAAQRAPTDATAQMYSLIRLTEPSLRKKIAELSGNPHIITAAETFLICADIYRLEEILKSGGFLPARIPHIAIHFAIGDAVLAGQSMLLAAEMLGYRGCWIGGVLNAPAEIAAAVHLPLGVFPFAALTLGVPDEPAQYRPRLPRNLVIHENSYKIPKPEELAEGVLRMASITRRGNWVQTLAGYFSEKGTMVAREQTLRTFLQKTIFR